MATRKKTKSTASAVKRAATGGGTKAASAKAKPAPKTKKPGVQTTKSSAKTMKLTAQKAAAPAKKSAAQTKKALAKTKGPGAASKKRKANAEGATGHRIGEPVLDPIGDAISGEGQTYLGDAEPLAQAEVEAYRAETAMAALDGTLEAEGEIAAAAARAASGAGVDEPGPAEGAGGETRPPAKLERLQKILSRAGIASRRHAEEMIVAGRVMVNGQVVTQLGSKADAARDHIRVDGKLLHGAERHRYFVLNKPKGYVTTVSDPEGRPTVMGFFAKMNERLYPVGRLDYQSEGLLLMTNDGGLANLLTKAGSGVEKTYLVKVAGQPSAEELERLRGGVAIERGDAGSEKVRTAPAQIRQVRMGDNPWYEVVLTEGRNHELRKMFAAIGHFAEKIRRVGYGPLVLDVEPGKLRELTLDEVRLLRLTAEGKMKPRQVKTDLLLPKDAGRGTEKRDERRGGREGRPQFRQREERGPKRDWKPREQKFSGEGRREFGGEKREFRGGPRRESGGGRREFRGGPRESGEHPRGEGGEKRFGSAERGPFRRGEKSGFGKRTGASFGAKPKFGRPEFARGEKPQWKQGERPQFERGERPPFEKRGEGKRRFEGGGGKIFGKGADFGARPGGPRKYPGAKFGGKPGGFGKSRGKSGGGKKFGGGRPGAARGSA